MEEVGHIYHHGKITINYNQINDFGLISSVILFGQ